MNARKISAVMTMSALVGVLFGMPALAAGTEKQRSESYERGAYQERRMSTGEQSRMAEQALVNRAGKMIGLTVKDDKGEELGTVKDFLIDNRGEVQYLILSRGGILGIGDKLTPIPFRAAEADIREESVVLQNVDKQKLEQAPTFSEREWVVLADPEFEREVYSYYGQEPQHQFQEQRQREQFQKESRPYKRGTYQQQQMSTKPYGRMSEQAMMNRAGEMLGRTVKDDRGKRLGTVKDLVIDDRGEVQYLVLDPSAKRQVSEQMPGWAGQVLGSTAIDDQGRLLGTVEDVVVDKRGKVQHLVLSSDTRQRLSRQLIPVPFKAAEMDIREGAVVLENVNQRKLEQAPNFSEQEWRKLAEPEFERRVYSYYGREPERQIQEQRLKEQLEREESRTQERGAYQRQPVGIGEQSRMGEPSMVNRAANMFGRTVKDDKGERLGTVKDVVFDNKGEVQYLVLSPDRSLGLGDKLIPIPYRAAELDMRRDVVFLEKVDKQKLQQAPNFSEQEWRKLEEPEFEKRVFSYYGQEQPAESSTMKRWVPERQMQEEQRQELR
ncbi:MAG: PRC-barrel domain-containing protein [Deltaproteobacteria bacterium]|nr:PRC-barrel domain-containing protein [Deltaproteobacteria bacterium]